jgi:hypothetical protein
MNTDCQGAGRDATEPKLSTLKIEDATEGNQGNEGELPKHSTFSVQHRKKAEQGCSNLGS